MPEPKNPNKDGAPSDAPLAQSYRSWFLDYASYVILDRAVARGDRGSMLNLKTGVRPQPSKPGSDPKGARV